MIKNTSQNNINIAPYTYYYTNMLEYFARAYQVATNYLFGWIDPCINYFFNNTMTQIAMDGLWFFSRIYVKIRNNVEVLSTKYVAIKMVLDTVQKIYSNIQDFFNTQPKEPADLPWGCVMTLEDNHLIENYTHFPKKNDYITNYYKQMQTVGCFMIIKTPCSIWCNRTTSLGHDDGRPPSLVKFISVVYKHPDMPGNGIELTVGREWYLVGNELFSAEFVARWLHYNVTDYVFDDRYTIQILDDRVNMVTLNHKQLVIVEKTSYRVVTV